MKLFQFKISDEPNLDEIEDLIEKVKRINSNELDLSDIIKLCSLLGAENKPELRSGGSLEKFQSKDLVGVHGYTHGIFSIHIVHKGGSKRMVYRRNFFETIKHLEKILYIKRNRK